MSKTEEAGGNLRPQRQGSPCPPEPGYGNPDSVSKNGKPKKKKGRVTKEHWRLLSRLKGSVKECKCGCEGNAIECKSPAAVKYRNLRHYIFNFFKMYVEKISTYAYNRRSVPCYTNERLVTRDDAVSAALQVMLRRIDEYDCDDPSGADFKTFIYRGASGAPVDQMRVLQHFPNVVAGRKRVLMAARSAAASVAGYTVTDEELMQYAEANFDDEDYANLSIAMQDRLAHLVVSNQQVVRREEEGTHDNIDSSTKESKLSVASVHKTGQTGIEFKTCLGYIDDDRIRDVVTMSYCTDLNATLIGLALGISTPLVSRLRQAGEQIIGNRLKEEGKLE